MALPASNLATALSEHGPAAINIQRAIYSFAKPIKGTSEGKEIDLNGVEMRVLDTPDLPLLDQFRANRSH